MNRLANTVYVTALGLWVGGMVVLGFIVAPTTFQTSPSRLLAGTIFGAILHRFGWLQIVFGVICLGASLALIANKALTVRRAVVRVACLAVMLTLVCVSQFHLAPEIVKEREGIVNFDSVPPGDPAKARFDRLHRTSVQCATGTLVIGVFLLVCAAWTSRPSDGT